VLAALSDYLAGELSEETVGRVEAHLAACPECERFGAGFGEMVLSLARDEAPDPPAGLLEAIRERLDG
jgi:anti-sigma factor RsiW